MPRIPKTLPAKLRQYYKTAPRPATAYGNDVFGFAADRLGRRNRAINDLDELDRYAMEQQARGRYNPDELNALARQIEADRMLTEMDFDRYFAPRYAAENARRAQRMRDISDLANYQRGYTNLAAETWGGNPAGWNPKKDFDRMKPYMGLNPEREAQWRNLAENEPGTLYDEIGNYGAYPDVMDFEMASAPIPENADLMDVMIPEDTGPYMTRRNVDKINSAIDQWKNLNRAYFREPQRRINFGTGLRNWRDSMDEPARYR